MRTTRTLPASPRAPGMPSCSGALPGRPLATRARTPYLFTREVAQVYACGTSDLGHKKDRDESIRYNRFVRQWRTRTSVLLLEGTARAIWTLAFGRLPSGVGDDLAFGQMGHIEPQVHAHP